MPWSVVALKFVNVAVVPDTVPAPVMFFPFAETAPCSVVAFKLVKLPVAPDTVPDVVAILPLPVVMLPPALKPRVVDIPVPLKVKLLVTPVRTSLPFMVPAWILVLV